MALAMLGLTACADLDAAPPIAKADRAPDGQVTRTDTTKQPGISPLLEPAPEVFEATGRAEWDGKRTLQGIWVAHPLAQSARRVRIFNTETGTAVDGALFKRDATLNDTSVLISSDAAQMLGMSPGEAANLRIVAVTPRKKGNSDAASAAPAATPKAENTAKAEPKAQDAAKAQPKAAAPAATAPKANDSVAVKTQPKPAPKPAIKPVAEVAKAEPVKPAADPTPAKTEERVFKFETDEPEIQPGKAEPVKTAPKAEEKKASDTQVAANNLKPEDRVFKLEPAPKAEEKKQAKAEPAKPKAKKKKKIRLRQPFIQAGTFGVPANARNLVRRLKKRGIPAKGQKVVAGGRTYTRVVAGPFSSKAQRDRAQRAIRKMGMRDAVPVRR